MGAGASTLNQRMDEAAVRELFGNDFNLDVFNEARGADGMVSPRTVKAYLGPPHHLWSPVFDGSIQLLDAEYLIVLDKEGKILQCRQELEKFDPHAFMKAPRNEKESSDIVILSISYPWITPQHPDPRGFHLRKLVPVLKIYIEMTGKRVAVFWDWASVFQNYYKGTANPRIEYPEDEERVTRNEDQERAFKNALGKINSEWGCGRGSGVS